MLQGQYYVCGNDAIISIHTIRLVIWHATLYCKPTKISYSLYHI